jgi:hypothetical protein
VETVEKHYQNGTSFPEVGKLELAARRPCRRGVQIAMAGQTVGTLVDTEAACSLMAKRIYDALCERTRQPRLLTTTEMVCGETVLHLNRTTGITVSNRGPVKMLVVDKLAHDVVEGQGRRDDVTEELQWYGKRFAIKAYPDHQPCAPGSVKMTSGHVAIDEAPEIRRQAKPMKNDESTDNQRHRQPKYGDNRAHLPIERTRKGKFDLREFADRHHRPPDARLVTTTITTTTTTTGKLDAVQLGRPGK